MNHQLLFADPVDDQTDDVDALAVLMNAADPAGIIGQWLKTATPEQVSAVWTDADALLETLERRGRR